MHKILLITNKFPYDKIENFIEAEMEYIPDDVQLVVLPRIAHDIKVEKRYLPQSVSLDESMASRPPIEYSLCALKGLFHKEFWDELKSLKQRNAYSLPKIWMTLGYVARGIQLKEVIERTYKSDLKNKNICIYSYWLTEGAYAAAMLRTKYGIKAVSRAHRTDLYDGESVYGTVPVHEYTLFNLDKTFVCSKKGCLYLRNKYAGLNANIGIGYLGSKDYGIRLDDNREQTFVIVSCARMVEVKRIELLAFALRSIRTVKVKWIHFGDGPERKTVEKALESLPENIEVCLMGNVPHQKVMEYYSNHSVNLFVNTSRSEGIPVSIMEAISFGIPAIATDVGGTDEIVCNETGRLIPVDFSPEELAKNIEQFIRMDAETYKSYRKSTRKFWEEIFNAEKNYRKFYSEIIS